MASGTASRTSVDLISTVHMCACMSLLAQHKDNGMHFIKWIHLKWHDMHKTAASVQRNGDNNNNNVNNIHTSIYQS